ncbi:AraC family transcriptional regulator [Pseudomonas sp. A2]|uniref:helix-turn-helix domain-containing protein n=1 Tax=Pseudomonas sp. A2 TaxID=107445 RepID=UPI002CA046C7|nr:AraC family transcriptional regulator [Pseudomonas sp. A2]MEB3438095.1 AraC family transcriptional regulator [Pseudomonas sp. A2]
MQQNKPWSKYSEFYQNSPYSSFPQEHRASQGKLAAHMILVEQSQHNFEDPSIPETIIALPLSTSENCQWSWNMGRGWTDDIATPGRMLLLPPDQTSQWSITGQRTLLLLAIPSKTIREVLQTSSQDNINTLLSSLSHKCWEDEFLNHSIQRLWKSINSKARLEKQITDGALTTIIVQLAIASGSQELEDKNIHLPAWRLSKLKDFVSQNIASDIDVSAMAAATGLSNRHFSRAFAEEMGKTPYRWLMEQRCEKAKSLLRMNEVDLSSIGRGCGFSDQSHFCKVFKEMTGETPRRWHLKHLN